MMDFITKKGFRNLAQGLIKDYVFYGPVTKDGFPAFSRIEEFSQLKLSQTPSHISAKGFLFPPKETLLRFDIEKGMAEGVADAEKQVLFGLHSCDVHAINLMDRVFSYGKPDVNYLKRRENTIIVGTECVPDEYCFCASIGTMTVDEGFDIFLHGVKGGFIARAGSGRGRSLLKKYASPSKTKRAALKELERLTEKKKTLFKARLDIDDPSLLPLVYSFADGHPVWEKIGAVCYGCGSCNNVCPTCYCFDVRDEVSMDLKKGTRSRVWDGCTLEDFAKVTGGMNFRKTRADRLRHRFNRKFRYLADRFKGLFCVGCGRCSRTCLVKINISEVTNEILRASKERPLAVPAGKSKG
ncbi:MAG: 4Fe-4S dicluster domain-containing protein [Deltaproteobacteria bacterium]|nr:4Fe-4S dicluster domain-containing protein [Deltaproteobacteria bacterium]